MVINGNYLDSNIAEYTIQFVVINPKADQMRMNSTNTKESGIQANADANAFLPQTIRSFFDRAFSWIFTKLPPFSLLVVACASPYATAEIISTAVFYGNPVPLKELSQYQRVIIEAEYLPDPKKLTELSDKGTTVFAYVSVGEAEPWRESTRVLDSTFFLGENTDWGSRVADLTIPGWRKFLIEKRMTSLWKQGYRAFFLDTLDSYERYAKDDKARKIQEQALVGIIKAMHKRFPEAQFILNRGFPIIPEVKHIASGVLAESLFQGCNPVTKKYFANSEQGTEWLLERLREANQKYNLPVTVVDYVNPANPELERKTAQRIRELGFAPWIATLQLNTMGTNTPINIPANAPTNTPINTPQ